MTGRVAKLFLAFFVLFFGFSFPAFTQTPSLEKLDWMVGQWLWLRDDGVAVEVNWAPALGNTMLGTLQQLQGENLMAYETLKLTQKPDGIFHTFDLFMYEDQFQNPRTSHLQLISLEDGKAVFEGEFFEDNSIIRLTIEKLDDNSLYSWFVFKDDDDVFSFTRYRAKYVPFETKTHEESGN